MTITVQLPDDVATHPNPGREALEALAIEGYKSESLSQYEAATLLGLQRLEFEAFLKERGIPDHAYGSDDLLEDMQTTDRLRASRALSR